MAGVVKRYTTFGAGSRGAYRFNDHILASVDLTHSVLGGPTTTETMEVGALYRPIVEYQRLQPFVDVRGAYMHLYNTFIPATEALNNPDGVNTTGLGVSQLSHGFGGVAGTGVDISLTSNFSLTTELSAVRSRLTMYQSSSATAFPVGTPYSTTSYRLMLGIQYNPLHTQHVSQNPTR